MTAILIVLIVALMIWNMYLRENLREYEELETWMNEEKMDYPKDLEESKILVLKTLFTLENYPDTKEEADPSLISWKEQFLRNKLRSCLLLAEDIERRKKRKKDFDIANLSE